MAGFDCRPQSPPFFFVTLVLQDISSMICGSLLILASSNPLGISGYWISFLPSLEFSPLTIEFSFLVPAVVLEAILLKID